MVPSPPLARRWLPHGAAAQTARCDWAPGHIASRRMQGGAVLRGGRSELVPETQKPPTHGRGLRVEFLTLADVERFSAQLVKRLGAR